MTKEIDFNRTTSLSNRLPVNLKMEQKPFVTHASRIEHNTTGGSLRFDTNSNTYNKLNVYILILYLNQNGKLAPSAKAPNNNTRSKSDGCPKSR